VEDHTNGSAFAHAVMAHVMFGVQVVIIAGSAVDKNLQTEGKF
jgi:hypothetical protein